MAISKPPGSQLSSSSVPSRRSATVRQPPHRADTCNAVIFGEAGAGKSSLVNLIAGTNTAATSSDAGGCTNKTNTHEIWIQNDTLRVKLFDTAGLDEDPRGTVPDKQARKMLKMLVQTMMKQGDIHLIIYCVRGERQIRTLRRNYKFIRSQAKEKVPVVLVVTSLESYEPDMEEWWRLNENTISKLGMTFAGHACVTTGMITQSNVTERGRDQSYDAVCKLIEQCRLSNETVVRTGQSRGTIHNVPSKLAARYPTSLESHGPDMEEWWRLNENTISNLGMTFTSVTTGTITQARVTERGRNQPYSAVCKLIKQSRLPNEIVVETEPSRGTIRNIPSKMAASNNKHTNIVLFGQAGAGKSSLINLMAGVNVAGTSNGMKSCTLRWQEYSFRIDGESYKVFDTVGLEEPQLRIPQYLDAVENAYTLIQNLKSQGGIDLLLFCMRAGKLTTTLQTNYRLFHEFLCEKNVPVVVVVTCLETEANDMDDWWTRNKDIFREREVHVAGHACITAIEGNHSERYEQSRITIRNVVKEFTAIGQKEAWKGDNRFASFLRKLWRLLVWKDDMVSRLVKRCGLSRDVAKQLADRIKNGMAEGTSHAQ